MKKPFNRRGWIIAAIRRMSYRYPGRYMASAKARVARGIYTCYVCSGEFRLKDTQMDHKEPVVGPDGFTNWHDYVERMLPEEDGWGRICKPCHQEKTNKENEERRARKALTKKSKTVRVKK